MTGKTRNEFIDIKPYGLHMPEIFRSNRSWLKAGDHRELWICKDQNGVPWSFIFGDPWWLGCSYDLTCYGLTRDMKHSRGKKGWTWNRSCLQTQILFGCAEKHIQLCSLMKSNSLSCGLIRPVKSQLWCVQFVQGHLCSDATRSSGTCISVFPALTDKDCLFSITHHIDSSEISFRDMDLWKDL